MRIPQDIANLLAVAIRDLIWFKQKVLAFLEECGVPPAIMVEAHRLDRDKTPTIKIVQHVLDRLAGKGDGGAQVPRTMLIRIYSWKDPHTLPADRKGPGRGIAQYVPPRRRALRCSAKISAGAGSPKPD